MALQLTVHDTAQRMRQFYALTKPRVTMLAVFCAVIGMFLATPGMVPWRVLFAATAGIALLAGAPVGALVATARAPRSAGHVAAEQRQGGDEQDDEQQQAAQHDRSSGLVNDSIVYLNPRPGDLIKCAAL